MTHSRSKRSSFVGRRRRSLFVWFALVVVTTYAGYQQVFSTFAAYDDEGYVMLSLRSFIEGKPLYDETFTQYGPAYYGIQSGLHGWLSLPITHDTTRLKTLVTWVLVAGICAFFVSRITSANAVKPRGLAMLTFCLVFLHLDRLCLEPGHPQELCSLGVAICLLLSLLVSHWKWRVRIISSVLLGVVCGGLLLTKLNVGLFLFVGIGAAFVLLQRPGRLKSGLYWLVVFGLTALPLLLFRQHLSSIPASLLGWSTATSAVTLVWVYRRFNDTSSTVDEHLPTVGAVGFVELIGFLAAMAATVIVVCAWTLANGTTIEGLRYGLFEQHSALQQDFFHAPPVSLAWILAGLLTATWSLRAGKATQAGFVAAGAMVLTCLVAHIQETWTPLVHGLNTRGQAGLVMSLVPGLLAVMVFVGQGRGTFAPRAVLACMALLQPLSAFPTPGTQTAVGTFSLLIVCVVLLADGLAVSSDTARASDARSPIAQQVRQSRVPWTFVTPALAVVAVGVIGLRAAVVSEYRAGLTPLNLPGADLMRTDKEFVRRQHWLVDQLRLHADTFVFGEHGQNSLYFWSGIQPPTALNTTFWPYILRDKDQQRVVDALDQFPRACVVRTRFEAELPSGPLTNHIDHHFVKAYSFAETEIWVRDSNAKSTTVISQLPH